MGYYIDSDENRQYCTESAKALLLFGVNFASPDGSSWYLGSDGTPMKNKPRETWITARMLHVYSIGAMAGLDGCAELAKKALTGLTGVLQDRKNGGWYAGIHPDGSILPGKQCYAHAFVILSACSAKLAKIAGAEELLKSALAIYDTYFYEAEKERSSDYWNTDFTVCDEYRGLNANMHSVEAFLAVADTLGDEEYRRRAGHIIHYVLKWAEAYNYRLPEHFTKEWIPVPDMNKEKKDDPFKPYGATPGHGMEWARLIVQWAVSTYGSGTKGDLSGEAYGYIKVAEKLYHRAKGDGWYCDGAPGFVYTTDWDGTAVAHDRMHWTLAEAINTSAILFRVTGKEEYAADYAMYLSYLKEKVADPINGSWYHQLDEKNNIKETVWPGKPDLYHAFQAMLIPFADPAKSIATEGWKILT